MKLNITKTTCRAVLQRGGEIISYSWRLQLLRLSLFMAGVVVASTGTAEGAPRYSVDAVPIQITNETRSGPESTLSAAGISGSEPYFRAFVTAVTEHVAARLAKDRLDIDSVDGKKRSLLQFVNWPLVTSGNEPLSVVPALDVRPSRSCRISSPWIDFAFERGPAPWVRGVVRWNERQLLADQAVLAGMRDVPMGVVMPLKQGEFTALAYPYADSEIEGRPAARPIEERIPPDLLWLFRASPQVTFMPFGAVAMNTVDTAMQKSAQRYTRLVIALIDRCFVSDGDDIRYSSILDVADLIPLEQYKINTPIR